MAGLHADVRLQAHLSSLPKGWDGECIADIVIVGGHLSTCTIRTVEGHLLLQQAAAFELLQRIGTLEWTVHQDARHGAQDELPGSAAISRHAPRSVASSISPEALARLSRRHKQVFLLSESHKHPEEIARLLHLSVQEVEQILHP